MKRGIVGVYMITCEKNEKKYIGASNDVGSRISQHFGPIVQKKYPDNPLYADIRKYGRKSFRIELLEKCTEEEKLAREQYWYDKVRPEYNFVRPQEDILNNPKVRQRALEMTRSPEVRARRKKLFSSKEYRDLFRNMHPKMRPVGMYRNGEFVQNFPSIRGAARWLDENTDFTGKSKASKVKEVCEGSRPTAYGYTFQYSTESVETIPKGSTDSIDTNPEAVNG